MKKTFNNGDIIRCFKGSEMINWKPVDVLECEYEKGTQEGLGFINSLGNYRELDLEGINGTITPTKWGKGFRIRLTPIQDCEETKHFCESVKQEDSDIPFLDCKSQCIRK